MVLRAPDLLWSRTGVRVVYSLYAKNTSPLVDFLREEYFLYVTPANQAVWSKRPKTVRDRITERQYSEVELAYADFTPPRQKTLPPVNILREGYFLRVTSTNWWKLSVTESLKDSSRCIYTVSDKM